MMLGVEVRRFRLEAPVAELARKLGIPVVTSFMGHGLLPAQDSPLVGAYLGTAGDPAITHLVEDSDCLLLLGVTPCDTNLGVSEHMIAPRTTILAHNRSVGVGHHRYPDVPLAALVEGLLARLAREPHQPRTLPDLQPQPAAPFVADDAPLSPGDITAAINDAFARNGPLPLAADMGDCMFAAFDIGHSELVAPGYYASMGYGVPAGLGLQAATGRRPLVLVGDGAFQMTGWELGNCRRYGWDPIVVVFNNRSWEMLRVFQPGSSLYALDDWDFAGCAAPLGGVGVRVNTRREFAAALERALGERGRFQLIDATLPRGSVTTSLARFVTTLKHANAARPATDRTTQVVNSGSVICRVGTTSADSYFDVTVLPVAPPQIRIMPRIDRRDPGAEQPHRVVRHPGVETDAPVRPPAVHRFPDDRRDVFRLRLDAHRLDRRRLPLRVAHHAGVDVGDIDAADVDALRAVFDVQRLGVAAHEELGGAVDRVMRRAVLGGGRRHGDHVRAGCGAP